MDIVPRPIAKPLWFLVSRKKNLPFRMAGAFFEWDATVSLQVFLNERL